MKFVFHLHHTVGVPLQFLCRLPGNKPLVSFTILFEVEGHPNHKRWCSPVYLDNRDVEEVTHSLNSDFPDTNHTHAADMLSSIQFSTNRDVPLTI